MSKLVSNVKKYRKECILAPLCKLMEALFELLVPLFVADIINNGIGGGDTKRIITDAVIMVGLAIFGFGFSVLGQFFSAKAATGFSSETRSQLYKKLLSSPLSETDKMGVSTMITRMTSDINQMQSGLNIALRLLLRSPFVVAGAFVCAFLIDKRISLIFLATILVLSLAVVIIMKATMPKYVKAQKLLDDVALSARENLTGVRVIRAFGAEEDEISAYSEKNAAYEKFQNFAGAISSLLNPLTFTIINLAIVALLWGGAIRVNSGALSQGMTVALYDYMSQILIELVKFANLVVSVSRALASAKRVQTALDMPSETENTLSEESSDAYIEFKNVNVKYADGGVGVKNVNFKIKKGETIGIIGGTGSGKSTVVNLLPRLYDASSGTVFLEGKDVKSYSLKELRKKIGSVLQKPAIFKGTIRSNVLPLSDKDEETLCAAIESAQAADVVATKENGYDSALEQNGRNLSGGQKQRISIARAIAKHPDVLILDDSSSALDYLTDLKLRRAIKSLGYPVTAIIVSQRASSVAGADKIIVMDEGEIVGIGTADELRKNCPVFREIEASQSSGAGGNGGANDICAGDTNIGGSGSEGNGEAENEKNT